MYNNSQDNHLIMYSWRPERRAAIEKWYYITTMDLQQRLSKASTHRNELKTRKKSTENMQRQRYSLDVVFFAPFCGQAKDGSYSCCAFESKKELKSLHSTLCNQPELREVFLVCEFFADFRFGLACTRSPLKWFCPVCRWVVYSGQRL